MPQVSRGERLLVATKDPSESIKNWIKRIRSRFILDNMGHKRRKRARKTKKLNLPLFFVILTVFGSGAIHPLLGKTFNLQNCACVKS